MDSKNLISIIMPCYNGAKYIANSVASVLNQTYRSIELIVVNDGSTDASPEILSKIQDPRLKVINQTNQGVCKARNRGLAEAKGDYIAFLDADDTWHPGCLEHLHEALQAHPQAALAYCGWQNIGLTGGRGRPFIPPDYEDENKLAKLFENCRWFIGAALTRRFAIDEAGGFDLRFSTAEDFLLWLKIGTRYPIVRVPKVLSFYHHHDGPRATSNHQKNAIDHWLAQQAFLAERPDVKKMLGQRQIRRLMHGELLRRGYECYWKRDLEAARSIFKTVMKAGYGNEKDWKYMLPSLLPLSIHKKLIQLFEKD